MAYTPTVWVSNPDYNDPTLTPTYLNKIETGIKDAHDLATGGGLTAGAGLIYSSGSVLAVGAGSNIVVNADDVALAASPSVTALTASQNNATAITLSGAAAGLTINGDTNLYRSAADTLKTDDKLYVVGDAYSQQGNAGQMRAGAAGPSSKAGLTFGSAEDTNLYRDAADSLKTDDKLTAAQIVVGANPGMAFASGTLASRPAAATANAGLMYLATDMAVLYASTGSAWVRLSEPAGIEAAFAGTTAPAGWELAYGQSVLRTGIYADLFAQISTTYGSADGTHFNLPDLRGRIPYGLDNMGTTDAGRLSVANTLGNAGGEELHALTKAEVPRHYHTADGTLATVSLVQPRVGGLLSNNANNYFAIGGYYAVDGWDTGATRDITGNTEDGTTDGLGSGSPTHNNMPPYILQNWAIRL